MRMYLAGLDVPPLHSIKDRTIRHYQLRESRLEVYRTQVLSLIAMGAAANISDPSKRRNWVNELGDILKVFTDLEFGEAEAKKDKKEEEMMDIYESFLKHLRPVLTRDESGQIRVQGLDPLIDAANNAKLEST